MLTISGVVIDAGISVVIFILGGPAQALAARLIAINKADAIVKICLVFIWCSPLIQVSGVMSDHET